MDKYIYRSGAFERSCVSLRSNAIGQKARDPGFTFHSGAQSTNRQRNYVQGWCVSLLSAAYGNAHVLVLVLQTSGTAKIDGSIAWPASARNEVWLYSW